MPSNADLIRRAHSAWLRSGHAEPTWSASTVEVHGGRTYVMLRRGGDVIAIYRYKPSTRLVRDRLVLLKRMPTHNGGFAHAAA